MLAIGLTWLWLAALTVTAVAADNLMAARGGHFPKTKSNVHLEMVFNYRLGHGQLHKENGVVDLVWGSSWAVLPSGMYNSAYIPYSVDNYGNSVSWYRARHPDWLEYRCDRSTLAFEFNNTRRAPLDFANSRVRAYQWANWVDAPLRAGYREIAVDTMGLTNSWKRCGHYDSSGRWMQQYSGKARDSVFRDDVLAWERDTYRQVHAFSKSATMQVNVSYDFGFSRRDNETLMTTADLLFDERGFTNWGVAYRHVPTPREWAKIVAELQYVQSKGLCYMTNGEEPELTKDITQTERLWVIGNYLLVRNDCTYMYMSGFLGNGGQDYGRLIRFPEYDIAIGSAIGTMTKTQGAWKRLYSNGLTLVNPYNTKAAVDLPDGNWVDVNGNAVSSPAILPRQTAQVLLKAN